MLFSIFKLDNFLFFLIFTGEVPVLSRPEHLSYSFLHALSYEAFQIKHHLVLVVLVAIKLDAYTEVTFSKLRELDISLSFKVLQELYATVLRFVLNRDREELLDHQIKMSELRGFAQDTLTCLTNVRGQEDRERAATERAQRILCQEPVGIWREAFRQLTAEYASSAPPLVESPVTTPRLREPDASPSPTLLISRSRSRGGSMGQAPGKPFSSPTSAFRKRVSSTGSGDSLLSRSRGGSMGQPSEPSSPRAASASYADIFPPVPEGDHEEIVPAVSASAAHITVSGGSQSPVRAAAGECPSTDPCSNAEKN